ncbi:hypothetical protein A2U01_0063792, partial [Trifolium medium]|nr:hypothetical protein [Trifolium medium]
ATQVRKCRKSVAVTVAERELARVSESQRAVAAKKYFGVKKSPSLSEPFRR